DNFNIPVIKVNLYDSATLPCSEDCSKSAKWVLSFKSTDAVAECNQTSCWSKEGYQMIHDQYLQGNNSLIITEADFSKRGWYTCQCDFKDFCEVRLQIDPLNTTVQTRSNESLDLKLDVLEIVELHYRSTGAAHQSSGLICTVDGHSPLCKPEYKLRASLSAALELRGLTPSDSGVYTIRDPWSDEVIHTYTVIVQDHHPSLGNSQAAVLPVWIFPVMGVILLLVVTVVLAVMNVRLKREIRQLRRKAERNGVEMNRLSSCGTEETLSFYCDDQRLEISQNNIPLNTSYGACVRGSEGVH
ncbi:hypothetical protein NFI96_027038, partial [Prochilodus magdalenae]